MTINNSVFIQLRNQMRAEMNDRTRAMEIMNEQEQNRRDKDMLGVVDTLRTHRLDDVAADKEAYLRGRDTLQDKIEADETQYKRGRDTQRDALEADKTQYDRSQDAAKRAFDAEKFAAEKLQDEWGRKHGDAELAETRASRRDVNRRFEETNNRADRATRLKALQDSGYNNDAVDLGGLDDDERAAWLLGNAMHRRDVEESERKAFNERLLQDRRNEGGVDKAFVTSQGGIEREGVRGEWGVRKEEKKNEGAAYRTQLAGEYGLENRKLQNEGAAERAHIKGDYDLEKTDRNNKSRETVQGMKDTAAMSRAELMAKNRLDVVRERAATQQRSMGESLAALRKLDDPSVTSDDLFRAAEAVRRNAESMIALEEKYSKLGRTWTNRQKGFPIEKLRRMMDLAMLAAASSSISEQHSALSEVRNMIRASANLEPEAPGGGNLMDIPLEGIPSEGGVR